jgi:hypothetical protein
MPSCLVTQIHGNFSYFSSGFAALVEVQTSDALFFSIWISTPKCYLLGDALLLLSVDSIDSIGMVTFARSCLSSANRNDPEKTHIYIMFLVSMLPNVLTYIRFVTQQGWLNLFVT